MKNPFNKGKEQHEQSMMEAFRSGNMAAFGEETAQHNMG